MSRVLRFHPPILTLHGFVALDVVLGAILLDEPELALIVVRLHVGHLCHWNHGLSSPHFWVLPFGRWAVAIPHWFYHISPETKITQSYRKPSKGKYWQCLSKVLLVKLFEMVWCGSGCCPQKITKKGLSWLFQSLVVVGKNSTINYEEKELAMTGIFSHLLFMSSA